ncbi:gamma-glutamyl phosphate reductase ProA [Gottschalkia acidurici 9a]|uniref:Gamma-glutamyl phosphate reductase n=1 Tax=Gottschalkia acidurici (strain ATCC 7906 / DSM 604 / BCRC 14475 / CIP 104303 / KCTC 5404 / NCIMB 10678 / 9a) TaxID=1128398 RepID=K0AZQ4_GOTA9|nr:glutamate-5-semialdehyde dehydrogenase [Gottschalkia acidurici]AFS78200.1 gamma-glutamyl phosphate reductase ProA [Gottschalkia acidurici 9a]
MSNLIDMGKDAKKASTILARLSSGEKNEGLRTAAEFLINRKQEILEANKKDLTEAKANGISGALLDRLTLDDERIKSMADGLLDIVGLNDPIGEGLSTIKRPNGLIIGQKRVPLGVIGIIYEARPNVTVDGFGLCLKTGNAVILRGGKEAINTNIATINIIQDALEKCGLPKESVQLVKDTSREVANEMMKLNEYLDVLIPRGGAGLIKAILENSTVPVIETGAGNCHVYVDSEASIDMAVPIIVNAKTQRPGVCNSIEKVIIHKDIVKEAIRPIYESLKEYNVEVRGDEVVKSLIPEIIEASEDDWGTEYLDFTIAIKTVESIEEAIDHINKYSTKHSESIITKNYFNAQKFLDEVDSAAVYVNASTRFTDGSEFGYGAEIGISTQKLHARGPMGLRELTSTKYIIYGNGQIRG